MPLTPKNIDWFFFDLDGTLWDHDTASREALARVCEEYQFPPDDFAHHFHSGNVALWKELSEGRIDFQTLRIRRFEMAMEGIRHSNPGTSAEELSVRYLDSYLSAPRLLGGHDDAINLAAERGRVAVLTNAPREVQSLKFAHLGDSRHRVEYMICADDAPAMKPDRRFYDTALERAGGPDPSRVVMIGDSWTEDADATRRLGWNVIWISHGRDTPRNADGIHVVADLKGVCDWLRT